MNFTLQSLSPKYARFCLKIEKICRGRLGITGGETLLLAVSGGADSVALALVFSLLAPRLDIDICAVHIDHGIRGNSGKDAQFTEELCKNLGIPFYLSRIDAYAKAHILNCGLEEAARLERYAELEKHRESVNADFIATAHHAGDLGEDIILRFLRGAGWPALGGMAWRREKIIRPLLNVNSVFLREFNMALGVTWREDESNQNLSFRRNRIRHLVMPILRCENPAIESIGARLHEQARIDADYWQFVIDKALDDAPWIKSRENGETGIYLPAKLLKNQHPAIRMRIFYRALNEIREEAGASGQNSADCLQKIEQIFSARRGGKIIQCGGQIEASYNAGGIKIKAPLLKIARPQADSDAHACDD